MIFLHRFLFPICLFFGRSEVRKLNAECRFILENRIKFRFPFSKRRILKIHALCKICLSYEALKGIMSVEGRFAVKNGIESVYKFKIM